MRSFAGGGSFGYHCSKHFPLDVGFLLCLAATLGCLNFSQRQIFIYQSVQCSTGQAWGRDLRAFSPKRMSPPHLPTMWHGEVGPSWRSFELRLHVFFSKTYTGANWGWAFQRQGVFLPAPLIPPLIPLGKFTVNIFPGTLSSFWQSLSVCRTVKLSRRSKLWEICFYSNP